MPESEHGTLIDHSVIFAIIPVIYSNVPVSITSALIKKYSLTGAYNGFKKMLIKITPENLPHGLFF